MYTSTLQILNKLVYTTVVCTIKCNKPEYVRIPLLLSHFVISFPYFPIFKRVQHHSTHESLQFLLYVASQACDIHWHRLLFLHALIQEACEVFVIGSYEPDKVLMGKALILGVGNKHEINVFIGDSLIL